MTSAFVPNIYVVATDVIKLIILLGSVGLETLSTLFPE